MRKIMVVRGKNARVLLAALFFLLASIALVLGIHRLLAEALTFVNVVGNCIATILVAKWDGALATDKLYAHVGIGAPWAAPQPKPAE